MARVILWLFVGLLVLVALALPALMTSGEAASVGLTGAFRQHLLELSGDGGGFQDGQLVFEAHQPHRITVEQLPTLEGRLRGLHYTGSPLADELIWYGMSLRECIALCLDLPVGLVVGDESLDGIWLDVNAARSRGLFDPQLQDWTDVKLAILDGLQDSYDLGISLTRTSRDVRVLQAGPGWAEHERTERSRRQTMTSGPGRFELTGVPTSRLLEQIQELLPYELHEGLDPDVACDVVLAWEPGDSEAFAAALAEQLDLRRVDDRREVDLATVEGEVAGASPPATGDSPGEVDGAVADSPLPGGESG
jgi:hypothetical protein